MKKGINIWSFPASALKDAFLLAKDAGFEGVEPALAADSGEINLSSTEKELIAVRNMAEDIGIELYSLSTGLYWDYWFNSDDAKERAKAMDVAKKQLEAAAILGCDTILLIPGSVNAEFAAPGRVMDYEITWNRSLEALQVLKDEAAACKVSIGLENVWNKFLLSPLEMRRFIDEIDSPWVGSYLDIGNIQANGFAEQWIRILGSRIKKVHFKDYRMDAGGLHGFVDLLAGDVDYPAVTAALKDIGYDDWVSAEMIPNYRHHTECIIYNTSNAMDRILGRK